MADDEFDPKPKIDQACHKSCKELWKEYTACSKRIEGKRDAQCSGQYFEYIECIDVCAAPKLWAALK